MTPRMLRDVADSIAGPPRSGRRYALAAIGILLATWAGVAWVVWEVTR